MKFIRFLLFIAVFVPCAVFGASVSDFQNATNLLTAARRGDIQTVQMLINSGVDINFVDSTGLSLVCTAVMNNDKRAIQILQMYGADASKCDRQIKQYREKTRTAARGEEYGFFSGLSSSHILALSAVGVAAVIGGVALLTDAFDSNNGNSNPSGGGSHGGDSGGGTGAIAKSFTVPYGPAYLTQGGAVDTSFNVFNNLSNWDTGSESALRVADFNYLRQGVGGLTTSQAILDGINPLLQNYLLVMHGYYSLASGYMGQNIFRNNNNSNVPVLSETGAQARPVRVALITGNGINPAGSADSGNRITYAVSTALDSSTPIVDKYLNNTLTDNVEIENTGFDFSGSGSAFNPFANVNDSALAKIVAGWEGNQSATGDLYGFVPNGQLAIYRTGNGNVWQNVSGAHTDVGVFTDSETDGLSAGDVITINGETYDIVTALSETTVSDPTLTINDITFDLASNSNVFIGKCAEGSSEDCKNIAIYVGTDGYWYVNTTGGNDVDAVYGLDLINNIYVAKNKVGGNVYSNFEAITDAVGRTYSVLGEPLTIGVDVIANTNVVPDSRGVDYLSVKNFTKAADLDGVSDLKTYYSNMIDSWYGAGQGGVANSLFNNYNSSKPMLIMPAGDYLFKDASSGAVYYDTLDAMFENYAPIIYGNNLNHSFMTVVAVSHKNGISGASTITGYGNGINSSYGKIRLSLWMDGTDVSTSNVYASRKCGVAGSGVASSGIDPWCFAASGPTAEMATASMAGAVSSVKSAFSYMSNNQIFTLLALTADGPYLAADTSGTVFTTDTLVEYLRSMYELPLEYNENALGTSEYLNAFKDVFGYGLVNLERAMTPGFSVYYYDGTVDNIVSSSGAANKFWGNVSTTSARASSAFALTGRSAITTSFYDVLQSADGTLSLPRVWKNTFAAETGDRRGLYMGDVLGDFHVGTKDKQEQKIGNIEFSMAMSPRAYNDNLNGLDDLRVAFIGNDFDFGAGYQRYLTDSESRFNGRANAVLALTSDAVLSDAQYKIGKLNIGARAFSGVITDESLLETDPVVSAQYEPGRLGLADGGAFNVGYNNDRFGLNVSAGVLHENNTVLGAYSSGLLALNGADTKYIDAVVMYKPTEIVNLFMRGTFANTHVNHVGGLISELSDIKSDAFALGTDIGGFGFTFAMPLSVVNGKMGYGYADFEVVENDGIYSVVVNDAHTEYLDLSAPKRELRFTTSYKHTFDEVSDAGVEFMYRVHPNNIDVFGNESIFMFKVRRKMGF